MSIPHKGIEGLEARMNGSFHDPHMNGNGHSPAHLGEVEHQLSPAEQAKLATQAAQNLIMAKRELSGLHQAGISLAAVMAVMRVASSSDPLLEEVRDVLLSSLEPHRRLDVVTMGHAMYNPVKPKA